MTLEDTMRQVLAEMALIQYGTTTSWNASGGGDAERDPRPSGDARPLADVWREKWERNPCQETVDDARAAMRAVKVRQVVKPTTSSEDDWILEQGEGFSPEHVAICFKVTATRVRRLRVDNDRDAESGRETRPMVPSASKETRVVLLTDRGLSSRQVADQVGLHKTQVLRILARHRNAA